MKNGILIIAITMLCAMSITAQAAESIEAEISRQKAEAINAIHEQYEQYGEFQTITDFPSGHPAGAISATLVNWYDQFNIYIWRENNDAWIEFEPLADEVFICSPSFTIVQSGVQYDSVKIETVDGSSQCGDVYIRSVFKLTYRTYATVAPDFNSAFTLIYDGGHENYTIEIPSTDGTPPQQDTSDTGDCFTQADLDAKYQEGYQAGQAACGATTGESASFNMFTNTLHVPNLDMGGSYWLDLGMVGGNPLTFELKGFGEN